MPYLCSIEPEQEEPHAFELDLNLEDPGEMRDQIQLQLREIRVVKAHQLPNWASSHWERLHKAINHPFAMDAFSKGDTDTYDRHVLEGLGILQLWVLHRGPVSLGSQWPPILKRIIRCSMVSKLLVTHLINFQQKRELPEEIRVLLLQHLDHLTPSTVWLLQQDSFWAMKA